MNIFEVASRQKLRFDTAKGNISVEDLWDLPLTSANRTSLDGIAIELHKRLRSTVDVVSFVDNTATQDPTTKLKFDIVKHVIEQRKVENAEAVNAKTRAETKQQLLSLIQKKRESAVEQLTVEELEKKLAEL